MQSIVSTVVLSSLVKDNLLTNISLYDVINF